MLHRSITRRKPLAHFNGMVIERPNPAAISDAPALVNDVEPLRPGRIRSIRSVAHVVDPERERELESLGEVPGDGHALLQRLWLRVADIILHIGFHLPFVGGMRFTYVYRQKIHAVFVVVVNLNDVANLAAKRRSGKTPEDQHQRPCTGSFANVKVARAVECHQPRVRRIVPDFQVPAVHVRQCIAHHAVRVLRASRNVGKHGESRDKQHGKHAG